MVRTKHQIKSRGLGIRSRGYVVVVAPNHSLTRPGPQYIFADMRELLLVEGFKVKNALSKSDKVAQVFRWSHFRKLAVRTRNVHYLCDLKDSIKAEHGQSHRSKKLDENFDTCLICATWLFDRCVFEEHHAPQGPLTLGNGYYLPARQSLGGCARRK